MKSVLLKTDCPDLGIPYVGKVRDSYDLGKDGRILVTTDRISAFDVVLPNGIPGKGKVLNKISAFWFLQLYDVVPSHFISDDAHVFPEKCAKYIDQLENRSMWVKNALPLPVECIVRGHLSGSGWKEYKESGAIKGIKLPPGLVESQEIPGGPIFTPSTKAAAGHDINISFEEMKNIVGEVEADLLRMKSIELYERAARHAKERGIIIADTKFEFSISGHKLMLIDELLTPDSSRFWNVETYQPGKSQDSYDKQIVRDYLLTLDWDKTYPGPVIPDEIVQKTAQRYQDILRILTA